MSQIKIPRIIHRIWLGNKPMPEEFVYYGQTWKKYHPEWEFKLWTDENMIPLINQSVYDQADSVVLKADISRYEVIYHYGGIYIDCDFECQKNIEPLLYNIDAFFGEEEPDLYNIAIIGSIPGHQAIKEIISGIPKSIENENAPINEQTGPFYATKRLLGRKDVTFFPPKYFYPYLYNEKHRKNEQFPEAYAVHHWNGSWLE